MNATYTFTINPRDAVPSTGRAAWIEQHGVMPTEATVTIEAPLALWARAGARITADGCVSSATQYYQVDAVNLMRYLESCALKIVTETGQAPKILDQDLLEKYAREIEERRAEKAAIELAEAEMGRVRQEGRIEAALALSNEQWLRRHDDGSPWLPTLPVCFLTHDDLLHPRVVTRLAEVRNYLKAEEIDYEACKEACRAALVEYAKRYDDLARAASEGYAVANATLDRIAEDMRAAIPIDAEFSVIDDTAWESPDERSAPRPEAFALLDKVALSVRREELPKAIGRWGVSRIVRVDVCPHKSEKHIVTAVLATLRTPLGVREITCSTESVACTHNTYESDDR